MEKTKQPVAKKTFLEKLRCKKLFLTKLILIAIAISQFVMFAHTANVGESHTSANFQIKHLLFAKVNGTFTDMKVDAKIDGETLEKLMATVTVNSVDTKNKKRDSHLKTADFFDAKSHPVLTFEMLSFDEKSLTANLTMRGITKKVVFDMEKGVVPLGKDKILAMNLTGEVNRKDFNIGNGFAAKVLSEEVKIEISFEFEI